MLSIQRPDELKSVTVVPNILPCEISYTGKTDSIKRFWTPQVGIVNDINDTDAPSEVAYFRGRKLLGRTTKLPKGYRGIVVGGEKATVSQQEPKHESVFSRIARRDVDEFDGEQGDSASIVNEDGQDDTQHETMNEISTFNKVTVWEHETLPDAQEPFSRGVEEWLAFAQTIHKIDS